MDVILAGLREATARVKDDDNLFTGRLALTNRRVMYRGAGGSTRAHLITRHVQHSMPLETITSIDLSTAWIAGHITVLAAEGSQRYQVNSKAGEAWVLAAISSYR